MTFPYSEQNAQSRRRLETLVRGLSEENFARSTDYGWTVSALMAHLAFWDLRMSAILQRWQEEGFDPSPIDMMVVNDALKVICHAMEPQAAAALALSAAEKIDRELETLTGEQAKKIEEHAAATETQFRMNRSLHRDGHLNDIEALLK
ncbi:MAG TPA: maleylpyruvate isomerase N-terminal domain-containing protein [Anaerolineales bacterium]|nr:maleylpyruvate isomerase N-terminal domain-containing protein [Anaerolineales bacterium]